MFHAFHEDIDKEDRKALSSLRTERLERIHLWSNQGAFLDVKRYLKLLSRARISKIEEVVRIKAFIKSSTSSKVEENPEARNRLENFSWSKLFQDKLQEIK